MRATGAVRRGPQEAAQPAVGDVKEPQSLGTLALPAAYCWLTGAALGIAAALATIAPEVSCSSSRLPSRRIEAALPIERR